MKVDDRCVDVLASSDAMRRGRSASESLLATTAVPSHRQNFAEKGNRHVTAARISPL